MKPKKKNQSDSQPNIIEYGLTLVLAIGLILVLIIAIVSTISVANDRFDVASQPATVLMTNAVIEAFEAQTATQAVIEISTLTAEAP